MTDPDAYRPPTDLPGLKGLFDPAEWMERSRCKELDVAPEVFFPERGSSTLIAKSVCGPCPVRTECLDYAIDQGINHGIWGGLSERQRRRVRRQRAVMAGGTIRHANPARLVRTQRCEDRANELHQAGWTVRDIAAELDVNERTVARYLRKDIA